MERPPRNYGTDPQFQFETERLFVPREAMSHQHKSSRHPFRKPSNNAVNTEIGLQIAGPLNYDAPPLSQRQKVLRLSLSAECAARNADAARSDRFHS
jgi:hypothetical protein